MTAPTSPAVWCTPADAQRITGRAVDADELARAVDVIDAVTGASDYALAALRPRNRRMLTLATAYQAAWAQAQVDHLDRHDVTSLTQEGGSVSTRDELSLILAPLAKAALKRCTWTGPRTVAVAGSSAGRIIDPTISDDHPWHG